MKPKLVKPWLLRLLFAEAFQVAFHIRIRGRPESHVTEQVGDCPAIGGLGEAWWRNFLVA
jgi:hypothetical protein